MEKSVRAQKNKAARQPDVVDHKDTSELDDCETQGSKLIW
jgi:hypothetical protein